MRDETSAPSFPWPWSGAQNRRLTKLVVLWILALNLWGVVAYDLLPISRRSPWGSEADLRSPLFARYDSGWYDMIARTGYPDPPKPGKASAHAFFPLYPTLSRYVSQATGVDTFLAALLVSYAALLFAMPLMAEEARARLGPELGEAHLPYLLLYPVSFFLASVYTESTFLLLALLTFREVRNGRLAPAALFAFLTGLTRAPAAALGPALGLAWLLARKDGRSRWLQAAALAALPLAGVLSWAFGIGLAKGEPGLFFRSMGAWRVSSSDPLEAVMAFFLEPTWLWHRGWFRQDPESLLPYAHFLLLVALSGWLLHGRRLPDAAWVLGAIGMALLTGTADGVPRYSLTVYPLFFALAEAGASRPALRRVWWAVSAFLLLYNSALFVNWHFIS
jgi:hypothetical protein